MKESNKMKLAKAKGYTMCPINTQIHREGEAVTGLTDTREGEREETHEST